MKSQAYEISKKINQDNGYNNQDISDLWALYTECRLTRLR